MFGKLLRKVCFNLLHILLFHFSLIYYYLQIFLGTLRAAEFEHLLERFWYALTETCLAFTVFRDDFNPRFVALFTVLLFLKSFHWLAEERVDFVSSNWDSYGTKLITHLFADGAISCTGLVIPYPCRQLTDHAWSLGLYAPYARL